MNWKKGYTTNEKLRTRRRRNSGISSRKVAMETGEGGPAEGIHLETSRTVRMLEDSEDTAAAQPDTAVSFYLNTVDINEDESQATTASTEGVSGIVIGCSGDAEKHDGQERALSSDATNQKGGDPDTDELPLKCQLDSEDEKSTEGHDHGEEKAPTTRSTDANTEGSEDPENGNVDEHTNTQVNSSFNNTHRKDPRSSKKHVEWQMDHEMELNVPAPFTDTGTSNPSSPWVNVGPVVGTDSLSQGLSGSSAVGNKEIKESPNDINAPDSESLTPDEEAKGRELYSHEQEDKSLREINDTESRRDDTPDPTESSTVDKKESVEVHSTPDLLLRRRPLSANGVWTRSGRFSGYKSLSEESLRPCSATVPIASGTRRLSLPLDNGEGVSDQHTPRFCWNGEKEQTSKFPVLRRDGVVADVEKQERKGVLVTYSEQEEIQAQEKRRDSSLLVKEKPPRPVSSNSTLNTRRRPSTGGQVRAAGRRPSRRPSSHPAPSDMAPPRHCELAFSREELRCALPRRNFFSCHNKALKDAGYEVEEESARPRRRRLLFFHHEDKSDDPAPPPPVIKGPFADETKENEHGNGLKKVLQNGVLETAVGMKRRKSAQPAVVECKPLQQYLTYVRDNPGEYRHMIAKSCTAGAAATLHPSSHPADNCHTARLVSIGRIFQERQSGGQRADEVLRAAYSLNPRAADPGRFVNAQRDKSPMLHGLMLSRKQSAISKKESTSPSPSGFGEEGSKPGQRSKPGSEDRQKLEAEKAAAEQLTEVEKRRLKAEEWARTVTTEQLVRAKLHVLKELGHEERELTQWWLAFRDCFYLRPRIRE